MYLDVIECHLEIADRKKIYTGHEKYFQTVVTAILEKAFSCRTCAFRVGFDMF